MTIGDNIKRARKRKQLTQKELGDLLGVSGSMIGQYETGTRNPKTETLFQIADALAVPVAELTEGSVEPKDFFAAYLDRIRCTCTIDQFDTFCKDLTEELAAIHAENNPEDNTAAFKKKTAHFIHVLADTTDSLVAKNRPGPATLTKEDLFTILMLCSDKQDERAAYFFLKGYVEEAGTPSTSAQDQSAGTPSPSGSLAPELMDAPSLFREMCNAKNEEALLLQIYKTLNRDGKEEAIKRMKELTQLPRYTDSSY